MGAAAPLLELPDGSTGWASVLGAKPPYCFRAAAPGSEGPTLLARKAGNLGFDDSGCAVGTKKVLRCTGGAFSEDPIGDAGAGSSGGGIHFIAIGALDAPSHRSSSSVPFIQAGIGGLTGAANADFCFRPSIADLLPGAREGALVGIGDADALAHIDWPNSQPEGFSFPGEGFAGVLRGLDMDISPAA